MFRARLIPTASRSKAPTATLSNQATTKAICVSAFNSTFSSSCSTVMFRSLSHSHGYSPSTRQPRVPSQPSGISLVARCHPATNGHQHISCIMLPATQDSDDDSSFACAWLARVRVASTRENSTAVSSTNSAPTSRQRSTRSLRSNTSQTSRAPTTASWLCWLSAHASSNEVTMTNHVNL